MKLSILALLLATAMVAMVQGDAELSPEDAPKGLDAEQLASLKSEDAPFQAEVKQLMHMIIHSIYSNVEVFLRELISNASDALDKIRQAAITDPDALGDKKDLEVRVRADTENRELHIIDTGVGMTRDELVKNLGTIAKSGTKEFMQKLQGSSEQDASSLIGQFGVGFYSAFLVADRVTVVSKSNDDDKQWVWQSDAAQSFSVAEDPRGVTLGRGTHITLHFKEEHEELLKEDKLRELVARYSEFIQFPIYLWTSKNVTEEVPLTEAELEAARAERAAKKAEKEAKAAEGEEEEEEDKKEADADKEEEAEEELPTTKSVERTVFSWEHLNKQKPLWTRPASEVTEEEYVEFYKHLSKDWQEPSKWEHFKAEGAVNFKALVYLPKKPPAGFWENNAAKGGALKLYVKRVFITDDWSGIIPRYLAFLRGVVDCSDLDLNVSREVLQQSKSLNVIKKKIVRKVLAMIQQMQDDEEAYLKWYQDFAKTLKYGVLEDGANKVRISKLLRFRSSRSGTNLTSFQEYVDNMRDDQEEIYYLAGASLEAVQNSPLLEKLEDRGIEVLYLTDALDEYVAQHLAKFDGKYKLTNVAREGLKLPGDDAEDKEKEEDKDEEEELADVLDYLKEQLKDVVRKVVVSRRLVNSPAALVAGSFGMTANMERILRSQTLGDEDPSLQYQPKPVLEVHATHPIILTLKRLVEQDEASSTAADTAQLLYDSAAVASGYGISDPGAFSKRMQRVLYRSLGLNEPEPQAAKEEEPPKATEDKDDL